MLFVDWCERGSNPTTFARENLKIGALHATEIAIPTPALGLRFSFGERLPDSFR